MTETKDELNSYMLKPSTTFQEKCLEPYRARPQINSNELYS